MSESIDELIAQLKGRREKYEEISTQVASVADELSAKILPALRKSNRLPEVGNLSVVIQSLGQLYKTRLDAESFIVKSLEKQVDLVAKYQTDEDNEGATFTSEDVAILANEIISKQKENKK